MDLINIKGEYDSKVDILRDSIMKDTFVRNL